MEQTKLCISFQHYFYLWFVVMTQNSKKLATQPSTEGPSGEPSADVFKDNLSMRNVSPAGDQTCFTGVASSDEATWLTQDVDKSKQVQVSFTGEVTDFEMLEDPVEEAF